MSRKADEHVDTRDLAAEELWCREADQDGGDGDDVTESKLPPAHKDTKHWCRGKVGREHTLAIQMPDNAWSRGCRWIYSIGDEPWYNCAHVELCTACGRIFRRNYGWPRGSQSRTALRSEECPDYQPADV